MKEAVDKKSNIRPHQIRVGDHVLLKQKSTKQTPIYDPSPYVVTAIWGTQIEAIRDGYTKIRDAQRWKSVIISKRRHYQQIPGESNYHADTDIGRPRRHPHVPILHHNHLATPSTTPPSPPTHSSPMTTHRDLGDHLQAPLQSRGTHTIEQQLLSNPNVIVHSTPANRPSRNRRRPDRYEPY